MVIAVISNKFLIVCDSLVDLMLLISGNKKGNPNELPFPKKTK